MKKSSIAQLLTLSLVILLATANMLAQATGTLRGQVTDPSGAVVTGATVTVKGPGGQPQSATTNSQGNYEFKNVAPGAYKITITAQGFSVFDSEVQVTPGKPVDVDIPLQIEVEKQQVTVETDTPQVSTSAESNANTLVLKGKDLDALSDDPDELQSELDALAGPSAGPNGGQIYIDGFTGGQLPPKNSIREIRVNSNPFSPEFDRMGFGRIEILTKPGTDKFHGQASFNISNSTLNSKNPFAATVPDYQTEQYSGNFGGPLSKKASFFFNAERRNIGEASVVNATVLDQNFNPVQFTTAVVNPRVRGSLGPRVDWQVGAKDTVTLRYQYEWSHDTNDGISTFSLPSLAFNTTQNEHQIQFSESHVFSATLLNELRFRYERELQGQTAQNFGVTVSVPGAFTSGGSPSGISSDLQKNYELQDYTQYVHGTHSIKVGGRLRVINIGNTSTSGYNGTFSFASLTAYQVTQQGLAQGLTMAQIRANGGGPNQFRITGGQPSVSLTYADTGLYASDDWRVRPNVTLSYGLRYETQNYLGDHGDFAPRLAVAWGLGSSKGTPKTVIRAGSGVFYERFREGNIENTLRLNGVSEQQYVIQNPSFFPVVPALSTLTGLSNALTVYQASQHLRAPYTIQSAVALERQLSKVSTLSVTYLNSRGLHQFFSDNINAPLPGTYVFGNISSGVRPLGNIGNVYQYISDGVFKQNQLIVSGNYRAGTRLTFNAFYTLGYANSNSNGAGSFPSNPYDVALDYGRAAFDVRHRVMVMGTAAGPWGLRVSPFVVFRSGSPYNISIGQDVNGDSIVNDRPGFANPSAPAVTWSPLAPCPIGTQNCITPLGAFNLASGATPIPLYMATGPNNVTVNMRVSKTFGFGPEKGRSGANQNRGGGPGGMGGGGDHGGGRGGMGPGGFSGAGAMHGAMMGGGSTNRRYNLTLSVNARNLFNNVNFAPPVGSLGSPLFGTSNAVSSGEGFAPGSSAANRRLDFQAQFNF